MRTPGGSNINANIGSGRFSVSIPDYFDRRQRTDIFETMGLFTYQSINLTFDGIPERVMAVRATASMFPTLRGLPQIGRTFNEAEDQPGRKKVVVIGHDLWQSRFGASPDVTGWTLEIDGEAHQVLGVMSAAFRFPFPGVKLWRPFAITPEQKRDDQRGREFSLIIARLKAGATKHQARARAPSWLLTGFSVVAVGLAALGVIGHFPSL